MAETRTFRVFVSSTFDDLEAERNALREQVYPALRKLCADHGARFQPIDLRWGVSREATLDQQTVNVCLNEIDRCRTVTPRPNFVVLLGNRYGWLPPPPQIAAEEFEAIRDQITDRVGRELLDEWYRRDDNADPPEYYLRPRTGQSERDAVWGKVESRLHAILAAAAGKTQYGGKVEYRASATEQEIRRGALGIGVLEGRAFCFVRKLTGHPDPGQASRGDPVLRFVDEDQYPLDELKQELRGALPNEACKEYEVGWDPETARPGVGYLPDLVRDVRAALESAICEQLAHPVVSEQVSVGPERIRADRALDDEGRAHRAFAEERCRIFVGRRDELAAIAEYLAGRDARPLVIAGGGGTGKSALLSETLARAQQAHEGVQVVYRFIGATAASSDIRSLLQGLCQELARRAGGDAAAVPTDYQDLVPDFQGRLERMGAQRPLIVLLDSLDQLSARQGGRGLAWLPLTVPAGVRMVVSTRPGDTLVALQQRRAPVVELGPMTSDDGTDMLHQRLAEAHRRLRPDQQREVLDKFNASHGNPLYLRLAFEEARRWRSDQKPERLATGVEEIIATTTFARLAEEGNHGKMLVSHALGYLAASRYGLAEGELVDLLSCDPAVYGWFLRGAHHVPPDLLARATDQDVVEWLNMIRHDNDNTALRAFLERVLPHPNGPRLPVVLWSRLAFDLQPYLTERDADGATLISFFHRELGDVATSEFLGEDAPDYHAKLADYFRPEPGEEDRPDWAQATVRGLSELPHHLIGAEDWDQVEETLTDFDFLEAKASRVAVETRTDADGNEANIYNGVRRLQDDYDEALRAMGGGDAAGRPRIIVTATDFGQGLVVRCPHCNAIHTFETECRACKQAHRLDDWVASEITCPNPDCNGPLTVNPFTVGDAKHHRAGAHRAGDR